MLLALPSPRRRFYLEYEKREDC